MDLKKKDYELWKWKKNVNVAIFISVACCIFYGNNLFTVLIFTIFLS